MCRGLFNFQQPEKFGKQPAILTLGSICSYTNAHTPEQPAKSL